MHAFSVDAARAIGSYPDARVSAAERAAAADWPDPAEEIWRYSRIADLDLSQYRPGPSGTTVTAPGIAPGVIAEAVGSATPSVVEGAPDVFAELNAAFSTPVVITVPAHAVVDEPIVITHHAGEAGRATFPRLVVDVGENAEVTVVERFTSVDDDVLVAPVVQLRAARAARVTYLGVNELSDRAWQIGHQQSVGDADSTSTLASVALGGHYARVRTEARISGRGGHTRQLALYFADGEQMHDFRTIQDHDAPHTTSDLLFKGAVQDTSASVYTGLIRIRPHARGTAAFQTNRNLTLGEGAWAESVPNLDIQTNDVTCSHASTVGPIDPEHRFYLESRGVPTNVAQRIIVLGFFDEVVAQLPVPSLRAELRQRVADKLDVERLAVAVA
ncbi:hypothetical protein BH24ACT5_BH24ACT5_18790 [soil metagenome]